MNAALVMSQLDCIGGAEKAMLELARGIGAKVYTTNYDPGKAELMGFEDLDVSSVAQVSNSSPLNQFQKERAFSRLRLKDHDSFIFSGDWVYGGLKNNTPNMAYVHSPTRELYDLYPYTRDEVVHPLFKIPFSIWASHYRRKLEKQVVNAQNIVANSCTTKKRIRKYWGMDSDVIYPPVDTKSFHFEEPEGYWLSVNRLCLHKRVDLQLRVFERLKGFNLKIVGGHISGRQSKQVLSYIRRKKLGNVQVLGDVSDDHLKSLYSRSLGLITTSIDEDFGMTAVEAMASGKPVVAPKSGGYCETVVDGVTGSLFGSDDPAYIAGIVEGISEDTAKYRKPCQRRAGEFDLGIFIKRIKDIIL